MDEWYYAEGGETRGPVSFEALVALLARVVRRNDVPVWKQGFKDWIVAGDVPELARTFEPPPLPVRQAAPIPARSVVISSISEPSVAKPTAMETAGTFMGVTAGVGLYVAFFAVGLIQISAFVEGMDLYFKVGTILSIIIFLVVYNIPFGIFAVAFLTYYGARYGWRWEWWQALALALPGIVITLFSWAVGGATLGITSLLQRRAR